MKHTTLLTLTAAIALASSAGAAIIAGEDFDALTGSTYPGTTLDGQGGWVAATTAFNVINGDGGSNQAYAGTGSNFVAYRNDGSSYLTAGDTSVTISSYVRTGLSRFSRTGTSYYDGATNHAGVYIGPGASSGWTVNVDATTVAASTDGMFDGDADIRLTINLITEHATFEWFNTGTSAWVSPTGMDDIDMSSALDTAATDGSNPLNWNSQYLRFALAGDRADNLSVSAVPEPSSAALIGLGGLALILRRRK